MNGSINRKMLRTKTGKSNEVDITSPTDWLPTFPELKEIDNLLRCGVCYDFLQTAMGIKNCSHTFCSLCIRKYFSYQNKCPECYMTAVESDLQNNRILDDIVQKFVSVRSKLLSYLKNYEENAKVSSKFPKENASHISHTKTVGSGKMSDEAPTNIENSPVKILKNTITLTRRKTDNQNNAGKMDSSPRQKTKIVPKKTGKKKAEAENSGNEDSILISSSESEIEEHCLKSPRKSSCSAPALVEDTTKKTRSLSPGIPLEDAIRQSTTVLIDQSDDSMSMISLISDQSSVSSNASVILQTGKSSEKNTVPCPVCGVEIRQQVINLHLDSCLAGNEKKSSLRKTIPKRKPMAKLVYNLLSDRDLRKKLQELGLSSKGDRKELTKRHHDFVLMYNAECDSLNPKSGEEIIKDIEKNETARASNPLKITKKLIVEKGSSPNSVRKAQMKYEKQHKKQFADLMKSAKETMHTRKNKTAKSTTDTDIVEGKDNETNSKKQATDKQYNTISVIDLNVDSNPDGCNRSRKSLRRSVRKSASLNCENVAQNTNSNDDAVNDLTQHEVSKDSEVPCTTKNADKQTDDQTRDDVSECSKCLDTRKDVSPCKVHKNRVHIQALVHVSPTSNRSLLTEFTEVEESETKKEKKTRKSCLKENSIAVQESKNDVTVAPQCELPIATRSEIRETETSKTRKANEKVVNPNSPRKLKSKTHEIGNENSLELITPGSPKKRATKTNEVVNRQSISPNKKACDNPESAVLELNSATSSSSKSLTSPSKSPNKNMSPPYSKPANLESNPQTRRVSKSLRTPSKSPNKHKSTNFKTASLESDNFTKIKTKSDIQITGSQSPVKSMDICENIPKRSPRKSLSNNISFKDLHTPSPRTAGLACSPLKHRKVFKTPDEDLHVGGCRQIVEDSEPESTGCDDSLIQKITKAIDRFESDDDSFCQKGLDDAWPALSQESDKVENININMDDSDVESDTSYSSDESCVIPETSPVKIQKTDISRSSRRSENKRHDHVSGPRRSKRKHSQLKSHSKRRKVD